MTGGAFNRLFLYFFHSIARIAHVLTLKDIGLTLINSSDVDPTLCQRLLSWEMSASAHFCLLYYTCTVIMLCLYAL